MLSADSLKETLEDMAGLDPRTIREYQPRTVRGMVIKHVLVAAMDGDVPSARLVFSSLAKTRRRPARLVIAQTPHE